MALSVLARLRRKGRFAEFEQGLEKPRSSPMPTAKRGFARGSLGSMGSTTLKKRNSDAGENRDRNDWAQMLRGS